MIEATTPKIESGIPIPAVGKRLRSAESLLMLSLKPGESELFPQWFQDQAHSLARRYGIRVRTRRQGSQVRIWRVDGAPECACPPKHWRKPESTTATLRACNVGDSFLLDRRKRKVMHSIAKQIGYRVRMQPEGSGVRVWRVA